MSRSVSPHLCDAVIRSIGSVRMNNYGDDGLVYE